LTLLLPLEGDLVQQQQQQQQQQRRQRPLLLSRFELFLTLQLLL